MTWNKIGQIKGDKGDNGDTGPPALIAGSVATVGDLPASGEPGKYYIVQANGNLYGWAA